jgi:hypothetical protein
MREYRRRKRAVHMSEPLERTQSASIEGERAPQTKAPDAKLGEIFKGAATRASCGVGPLRDFYVALLDKGMRPEMARLTLARKIAAIAPRTRASHEPIGYHRGT